MGDVVDMLVEAEFCVKGHPKDLDMVLEWEGDRAKLHLPSTACEAAGDQDTWPVSLSGAQLTYQHFPHLFIACSC